MFHLLACHEITQPVADTIHFQTASWTSLATLSGEELAKVLALGGWIPVALVAIIGGLIAKAYRTRAREQTRREIAAYIAEGSMTPEQGERLLNAGRSKKSGWCGDDA